jgi:hypothetical protein
MNYLHEEVGDCTDIESVRKILLDNGWQYLCEGDWAWIYLAPNTGSIARLCTFGPAYRLYLDCCIEHSSETHLPTIELLHDMPHGSHVAIMEYFSSYDTDKAEELCTRLADDAPRHLPEEIASLHAILSRLHNSAKEKLFQFGKFDLRPAHIMIDRKGEFVVLDPIFVDGKKLIESMQKDLVTVIQHYSTGKLLNFLKIAAMAKNPDDPVINLLRNELLNFRI